MTFADTFNIREDSVSFNLVANALDALITGAAVSYNSGVINTASGVAVDYGSLSHSVIVASGEKVLLFFAMNCSNSTAGQGAGIQIYRDATAIGVPMAVRDALGGTTGATAAMTSIVLDAPSPGTYVYKPRWNVTANTAYSLYGNFGYLKFRVS